VADPADPCALLDGKLRARLAEIIAARGITAVVETGIDKGGSTILFAGMVPVVIGVDNVQEKVEFARARLNARGIKNVALVCGNSPDVLRDLVEKGLDAARTLFFLDAHWQAYWPLLDEIRVIPRGQGVLVMHDVHVPGCDLAFDVHSGQELSYEYVRDELAAWSPTHTIEYNDDTAEYPRRGVMFVFP